MATAILPPNRHSTVRSDAATRGRARGAGAPVRNPGAFPWRCISDGAVLIQPGVSKQTERDPVFSGWDSQIAVRDERARAPGAFCGHAEFALFGTPASPLPLHLVLRVVCLAWCCSYVGLVRKIRNFFVQVNGVKQPNRQDASQPRALGSF